MNNKILASAIFALLTTTPTTYGMSFWDEIDDAFKSGRERMEKFVKQFDASSPLMSVTEDTKLNKIEFEFNFAGYEKEEISIAINDGVLKINADKKKVDTKIEGEEKDGKKCLFKLREIKQKSIAIDLRKFNVNLDELDKIETTYKNGILKMSIPQRKTSDSEIKIKIKEEDN